jgi:paired amphipathic helix protein Sin3a
VSQFGHGIQNHHVAQAGPSGVQSLGPGSQQEELPVMFFERAKRALEARDVYDDFLKLLNMYTRDIIDLKTLVVRAEKFLADDMLIAQFKALVKWDDKIGNVNYGPPGSIRTGPHDATLPRPVDDADSPSYRRLPESVSGGILVMRLLTDWAWLVCAYRRYGWRRPGGTNSHVRC